MKPPLLVDPRRDWTEQGLCWRMEDLDAWFPSTGRTDTAREAKDTCNRCPVRVRCLQYALDNREDWGVWGGTTPDERAAIRAAA